MLPSEAMAKSRPLLLLGAMFEFMVLWSRSVLVSQAHIATKDYANVPYLNLSLRHCSDLAPLLHQLQHLGKLPLFLT